MKNRDLIAALPKSKAMYRTIKFRGKRTDNAQWIYGSLIVEYDGTHKISYWVSELIEPENNFHEMVNHCYEVSTETVSQYTGRNDKHGNEIFERDIIMYRTPYMGTQTHYGDNIPNGSYTEPTEPCIKHTKQEVVYDNCVYGIHHKQMCDDTPTPVSWLDWKWDEESIKDAVSVTKYDADLFHDPEEGNLSYLLEEYKLKDMAELIEYLSGVEVIGNVIDNPHFLNTK